MAETVRDVMTADPRTVSLEDSVVDAARTMRDADVGSLVVTDNGGVVGIVTDRDITIRAVAEGGDVTRTRVGEVCSREVTTLEPDQDIDEAIELMRGKNIRRLPVVENGRPVGIVSLGDLAVERDPDSVLADISAAPPND